MVNNHNFKKLLVINKKSLNTFFLSIYILEYVSSLVNVLQKASYINYILKNIDSTSYTIY